MHAGAGAALIPRTEEGTKEGGKAIRAFYSRRNATGDTDPVRLSVTLFGAL